MRSFRPGFRTNGSLDIKSCKIKTVAQSFPSPRKILNNTLKTDNILSHNIIFPHRLASRHFATNTVPKTHPVAPPKKKSKRPSNLTPIGVEEFIKEIQRLKEVQEDTTLTDEQKAAQIFEAMQRTLPFQDASSEEKIRQGVLEMQLLLARGQLPEALACADNMLSKNIPNLKVRSDLFIRKGQIHFTLQQYKQGLDAADDALKIDPISFDARICRALCTVGEKRNDEALAQIESIIGELNAQADPRRDHLATAYNAKGTILYATGAAAAARYWMQKGLQYNPDGSLQHIMLRGVEYMERKQYQKALQIFEEDIQKLESSPTEVAVPAKPKLLLLKAKALVHLNRFNDALTCLEEVASSPVLFPTDRGYMVAEKSRALLGLQKPTEAMKFVQEALTQNPEIGKILLEEQIITSLPGASNQIQFAEKKKRLFEKSTSKATTNTTQDEVHSIFKLDEK